MRSGNAHPEEGLAGGQGLHVRLIDFGSAVDAHSVRSLYGEEGPSAEEQTLEYAPPEALLGRWAAHELIHFALLKKLQPALDRCTYACCQAERRPSISIWGAALIFFPSTSTTLLMRRALLRMHCG